MDGQPLDLPVQYQVLRSLDNKTFEKVGGVGNETRYSDGSVQNGQNYSYKVQSVLQVDGNAVDGGVSDVATVTPVDLTPPESPAGVTVIATNKGFKIFWENSTASDLQGYHVYRRAADQKKSVKIGDVEPIHSIYEDTTVPADGSFYYSVTASDNAKPANESKPSAEATVRQ
jgi:fibronectin type 3 domain-containing protein